MSENGIFFAKNTKSALHRKPLKIEVPRVQKWTQRPKIRQKSGFEKLPVFMSGEVGDIFRPYGNMWNSKRAHIYNSCM